MHMQDSPSNDVALLSTGCIALNLRRATRIITRRFEDALRPVDLTSFQFSALSLLRDGETLSQSALAAELGMDVSTLNRNIQPLLKRGLISSADGMTDKRVRMLSITGDGADLFEKALPFWAAAQRETIAAVDLRAWDMMRASLDTMTGR